MSEVNAAKAAGDLRIPVFVIAKLAGRPHLRSVRLAWIEGWEDHSENFLISYDKEPPARIFWQDSSDNEEFLLKKERRRQQVTRNGRNRSGQARFKIRVFQRYEPRCPLSGLAIAPMIEAAHICPVHEEGSDDPRNGLPLSASLHRAYDADLFAINPTSLAVETRPGGPSIEDLQIRHPTIEHLPRKPHPDALQWRYDEWCKRVGIAVPDSRSGTDN